ncbi:hypothetical protein [Deinococcus sedimenti]|uniref:Uncharacterized protein n=1 Tax=Deinococcus sedimenti TaxID=1867090 RepID=A0ABQ2S0R3_9DEIO|nr:hypothetical protein [Deinococcus sedimenti]GGR86781.1 hypothetical protein GCM10008960_12440 [Deinococcus sedimenti]
MLPLLLSGLLVTAPLSVSRTPALLEGARAASTVPAEGGGVIVRIDSELDVLVSGDRGQVTRVVLAFNTQSPSYPYALPDLGSRLGRLAREYATRCFGLPAGDRKALGERIWQALKNPDTDFPEFWSYGPLDVQVNAVVEGGYSRTLGDSGEVDVPPDVSVRVVLERAAAPGWVPGCRWP